MNKKIDLAVIGDVLVDITAPAHGLVHAGVNNREICINCGGLANVAYWASKMGIKTAFIGRIGDDHLGIVYREDLIKNDIIPCLSKGGAGTGVCLSLLNEHGERTFVVSRGENDNLKFTKELKDMIRQSKAIYLSCYSFSTKELAKEFVKVLDFAKKNRTMVILNGGSYNVVRDNRELVKSMAKKYCDMLMLNEAEAMSLAGKRDIDSTIKELSKLVPIFIITMGKNGSLCYCNSTIIRSRLKSKVKVVDSTGAGDAFAAGFLSYFIKGKGFASSLRKGHEAAAYVIQRKGAR